MTIKIKTRRWFLILYIIGMITLIGCDLNDSTILSTQETTEERFANGPTSDEQMITEEQIELTPTKTILPETEGPEVQMEGDINLSDIPMGSPTNLEVESIDLNEWGIQAEEIWSIQSTADLSQIVVLLKSFSKDKEAQIAIFEESMNGVWTLVYSKVLPGLYDIELSHSGVYLALIYRDEQRIALFDMDQKEILTESQVYSPLPMVSWSEDDKKLISFVRGYYGYSSTKLAEIFSVPSLSLIETVPEIEDVIWDAGVFWLSPDIEINKFIIQTENRLVYWEGDNYEFLRPISFNLPQTPIRVLWINENEYLVMFPSSDFYLFYGPELVDEYIISQEEGAYQRFTDTVVNPENLKIGALRTDIWMVLLEIRDDEIRSLCQVDIKSIADFGPVELYGFISLDSVFYLSEDNLLHIISNITCD